MGVCSWEGGKEGVHMWQRDGLSGRRAGGLSWELWSGLGLGGGPVKGALYATRRSAADVCGAQPRKAGVFVAQTRGRSQVIWQTICNAQMDIVLAHETSRTVCGGLVLV